LTLPIRLDSVSKCYRIYRQPQDRFKQAFIERWRKVLGAHEGHGSYYREHWALRDISFEVRPGEAVGILGRNGAGKSTLLQIIAGTLQPTGGTVETNGRITALLELGSAFNPEFTGRENVFLNAAVLGLTRAQTENRYDEIAAFAAIGDFIDQPVKTYSSGMMMRLAFAVQTAIQPTVLIVDEALAVGDMYFQVKCMARLKQLLENGVSMLFVSHSIDTVRQLCTRAVLLDSGRMAESGAAAAVADVYQRELLLDRNSSAKPAAPKTVIDQVPAPGPEIAVPPAPTWAPHAMNPSPEGDSPLLEAEATRESAAINPGADPPFLGAEAFQERAAINRVQNGMADILNVQMLRQGLMCQEFDYDEEVTVRMVVRFNDQLSNVNLSMAVTTLQGTSAVFTDSRLVGEFVRSYDTGSTYAIDWKLRLPIMHGEYLLRCGIAFPPDGENSDWRFVDMVRYAYEFRMRPRTAGMVGGLVVLPSRFSAKKLKAGND
jgi:lipopolysaccharide transport system ATP-binding protein